MTDSEKMNLYAESAKKVAREKTGNPMVFLAAMIKLLEEDEAFTKNLYN